MSLESLRQKSAPWDYYELEAYFNGTKRLAAIGVSIPPEMRALEMVAAWPRLVVEALVERLTPEGFYLASDQSIADEAETWWHANEFDIESILLHTESLAQKTAYTLIGPGEDNMPRYTVHTRRELRVELDSFGRVKEALRPFDAEDGTYWEAHYEPGKVSYYGRVNGFMRLAHTEDTGLSRVPVVAFANRARIGGRSGESEMRDVMGLSDACSRSLTNLQVAQELVSMPQRYMIGANPDELVDQNGVPKTAFEVYIGRMLMGPAGAEVGQLPGAQLDQIINTIKLYAQKVASVTGLPNSYLGINTDNPASGQAINAAANRHIKKAEQKQMVFGRKHAEVAAIGHELVHGTPPRSLIRLEMQWRNAATITLDEVAQGAIALTGGEPVIPPVVARDLIGLTPEQKRIANEHEQKNAAARFATIGGLSE
ncbi:phage portal protein [Agromyces sp. NPDC127015]|uniref:phage portal protein n=1 Tax=Agromyces sp. NPDC127015 TaxID=3347108 RepID=UPI0036657E73